MLTEVEIQNLVDKIVQRLEPEKVIIFGSYAKATATAKSDLDLLVVKDTHLPLRERHKGIGSLLAGLLIRVDVHVYTPEEVEEYGSEEYSFMNSILKTGKILYEQK